MEKHNYHMVLTKELKNKLKNESKKMNKTLSSTAIYIIEKTLNYFKYYYFKSEEKIEYTNYKNIFWDKSIHIYFEKITYRKIKHLADSMFAYSIAIVIRKLFELYFKNINNIKKIMKKIDQAVEKNEKKIKTWKKNIKSEQLSGNLYQQITYNDKFCIIGFNFLSSG